MSGVTRTLHPPSSSFRAVCRVPGDKSLSHRALILAAMARGTSIVNGWGPGEDVASTRAVLGRLGVVFNGDSVVSPGVEGWSAPDSPLDCANSGTTMRLLAGALAGRPFSSNLDGDASLRRRPMRRLAAPLRALRVPFSAPPRSSVARRGAGRA